MWTLRFFAVASLAVLLRGCGASSPIYLNPALQEYQDPEACLPLQEKWYTLYRNFESEPAFGGTAKCNVFNSLGPAGNDGAFPFRVDFGNTSVDISFTLSAFGGYTINNILNFRLVGQNESMLETASYVDCAKCAVFRNTYISVGSCSLIVPESALGQDLTCCEFVFDLLCDPTPKFTVYDESCSK